MAARTPQSNRTIIRHLKAVLKRAEDWDCTSIPEDNAIRTAIDRLRVDPFDESELATVLAALRLFQKHFDNCDGDSIAAEWPDHFTRADGTLLPPLGTDDIDTLCERINR